MLQLNDVSLRCALRDEKEFLWRAIYVDQKWKRYDAPYIPLSYQSKFKFSRHLFKRLRLGETALVIDYQDKAVGYLTYYWENQQSNWLEIGITIFYPEYWNKKIGRKAIQLWVSHLFNTINIRRIGLSTWSGNPMMMKCAESLGMKREGCFRKVLKYNNELYDSLHYGILKEEWEQLLRDKKQADFVKQTSTQHLNKENA